MYTLSTSVSFAGFSWALLDAGLQVCRAGLESAVGGLLLHRSAQGACFAPEACFSQVRRNLTGVLGDVTQALRATEANLIFWHQALRYSNCL